MHRHATIGPADRHSTDASTRRALLALALALRGRTRAGRLSREEIALRAEALLRELIEARLEIDGLDEVSEILLRPQPNFTRRPLTFTA